MEYQTIEFRYERKSMILKYIGQFLMVLDRYEQVSIKKKLINKKQTNILKVTLWFRRKNSFLEALFLFYNK